MMIWKRFISSYVGRERWLLARRSFPLRKERYCVPLEIPKEWFPRCYESSETTVLYSEEGAAPAAAIIAGVGVGVWPTVEDAMSLFTVETRTRPIAENVKVYHRMFSVYKKLYGQLKPTFNELSSFPW